MTSSEIRQSFLDFFREKHHTIVPSSPLLPDAPNLLFTNAGMNQFVPIFLGHAPCPYAPPRAADTQKCIRAGGKHNDLEDVGFDTYHHTFFEMLGNWSFGDYFKKEAISWAWELVVGRWHFPPSRIYATVYCPNPVDWDMIIPDAIAARGDYAAFQNIFPRRGWRQTTGDDGKLGPYPDFEAACHWVGIFIEAGLDPEIHVVPGNQKDNFWMMGDTGPCGPCSELHVNLTPGPRDLDIPRQIAGRNLVNTGDARCIEIWNLVFIQFNADPRAEFPLTDLPARHVDTGMGFERVTSMIQGTKGFTDFEHAKISNYETDVFRPLFDELEKITGKKYGSTLPASTSAMEMKEIHFHLNTGEQDYGMKMRHAEEALREGQKVKLHLKFRGVEMGHQDEGMALMRRMRGDLSQLGSADAEPELIGKSINLILSPTQKYKAADDQLANDVAFRVIADHIRTLSFSIADGIQPSNEGRGYVLRRILRRAVRYGRNLGLKEPFLGKMVDVLGSAMGHVFPEVVAKASLIKKTLSQEEEGFLRTLETGVQVFERFIVELDELRSLLPKFWSTFDSIMGARDAEAALELAKQISGPLHDANLYQVHSLTYHEEKEAFWKASSTAETPAVPISSFLRTCVSFWRYVGAELREGDRDGKVLSVTLTKIGTTIQKMRTVISRLQARREVFGEVAFKLYDTFGFPLDLTELMARERGLTVDVLEFERLMEEQKERSRSAQKKEEITVQEADIASKGATEFVYDQYELDSDIRGAAGNMGSWDCYFIPEKTPFYTAMGGQVEDTGTVTIHGKKYDVIGMRKFATAIGHLLRPQDEEEGKQSIDPTSYFGKAHFSLDEPRRAKIEAHHSGTHLLNWALRKVLGTTVSQKGSYVGPDRLRFDFSHGTAVTPDELAEVERLVNEKIEADVPVKWEERPYAQVKGDPSILQFFGDKYGESVRVVSIGDFSRELCGGTHVRHSNQVGYFKILHESAIAAGIRRIEAASGEALRLHLEELLKKQEAALAASVVAAAVPAAGSDGARLSPSAAGTAAATNSPRSQRDSGNALAEATPLPPSSPSPRSQTPFGNAIVGATPLPTLWQTYKDREKLLHDLALERIQHEKDAAKKQEAEFQKRAATEAPELIASAKTINDVPFIARQIDAPAAYLPLLADALKSRWQGVAVLAAADAGKVALLAAVAPAYTNKVQAGKIIQTIAPLVGGKGGGRPELAQGGGTNPANLPAALAKAETLLG